MEKLYEAAGVVNTDSSLTEVDRGSVMRIRLRVDVTLPLYRGRIFSLDKDLRDGSPSSTNNYQTSVTGVAD